MMLSACQFRSCTAIFLLGAVLGISTPASAGSFTLTLTPTALGLKTVDTGSGSTTTANYESEILDDQPGLRTGAPGVGGSYLEVNGSMLADDKANGDHFVTITSETHGDNTINVPSDSDYHFGVVTLTDQKTPAPGKAPDPKNLGGLGLRAFEDVDDTTGLRIIGGGGNAGIGGSKEVSGGTDFTRDFNDDINGPPHVDELVNFDFDGIHQVDGKSVDIMLTKVKFDNKDDDPKGLRIALQVSVFGGGDILNDGNCSMSQLDPGPCKVYDTVNDSTILITDANGNVTIHFDSIIELAEGDILTKIRISALDDDLDPDNMKETAEHFLINGLSGEYIGTPEPSTGLLMAMGLIAMGIRRRR
jgi:hypothetical protein